MSENSIYDYLLDVDVHMYQNNDVTYDAIDISEYVPPLLELHEIMQQIYNEAIGLRGAHVVEDDLFAKLQISHKGQIAVELDFPQDDAVDFISGEPFVDGSDAYILDDTFQHPLSYETLTTMIGDYGQIKNPFTREDIKRILKIKINYEK